MRSPYDYIGTSKAGNRVARTDLMLLDALSNCYIPVTTGALVEFADPRGLAQLTSGDAIRLLSFMLADGYVERAERRDGTGLLWSITEKGRAHLIACEAKDIFDECARHTPVARDRRSTDKPHVEEAPHTHDVPIRTEAGANLHKQLLASHTRLDELGIVEEEPATALLCVDEDELDDWWQNLDVEAKADAFVQWSLGNDGRNSHVYIEEPRIPLAGTVGESPEEWAKIADRFTSVSDKLRAGGIAAVQS